LKFHNYQIRGQNFSKTGERKDLARDERITSVPPMIRVDNGVGIPLCFKLSGTEAILLVVEMLDRAIISN